MNRESKNVIMITAGGVGRRFGANVPKQFLLLNGKPVIEYVIDACKASKLADEIVVVSDSQYHDELTLKYQVDVEISGSELNITKRNGLNYIKRNSSCEKLVVVEAVRPTITPEIIDKTFELLDENDAVACARKITDSLGSYEQWIVNRENYYTLNPPEGFRFDLLERNFSADSPYTESIQQLPEAARVYLNFDAPYFEKITYPGDLERIELLIRGRYHGVEKDN